MTRHDDEYAKKLVAYIDQGNAELKAGTAYRLQLARAEALARLGEPRRNVAMAPSGVLVGAGTGAIGGGSHGFRFNGRLLAGIVLIVVAVFGFQEWRAYQQLQDIEETDAAILSSDLPIDAYLDRGFQNWLNTADSAD